MIGALEEKISSVQAARSAMNDRNWNLAIPRFQQLVWDYTDDPQMFENLAYCYEKTGAPHKAVPMLKIAHSLNRLTGRAGKVSDLKVKISELELFLPYFDGAA